MMESVQQLPEGIDGLRKYMIQPFAAGDNDFTRWKKVEENGSHELERA